MLIGNNSKQEQRTSGLYEGRFGRKPVTTDRYFYNLITYIHHNPQKHGFVDDFRDWPYTSYDAILSDKPTRVGRTAVLDWFGGVDGFTTAHQADADEQLIYHLQDLRRLSLSKSVSTGSTDRIYRFCVSPDLIEGD